MTLEKSLESQRYAEELGKSILGTTELAQQLKDFQYKEED